MYAREPVGGGIVEGGVGKLGAIAGLIDGGVALGAGIALLGGAVSFPLSLPTIVLLTIV